VEIAAPDEYEVKRGKWSFANLPVIPPHFDLRPIAKTESRLKVLNRLIKRKDVTALINACDAGREGELIFRLIAQQAKAKQPVRRLWLQSMTPQAIRDGFAALREDEEMLPLADAARCRSEADWLVGINGTRAMTAFNSKGGGFFLTTVGRVQTPTLSIVVEREEKIKHFVPRDYWEVRAEFAAAGLYEGRWFDPKFKKNEFDPEARDSRLWSEAEAKSIVAACRDKPGTVTEESKPSTQQSPALFDLTTLQREANSRFGFSAKNTLGLAQALYEKHKVLTYPRTDARALPEDYLDTVKQTMDMLADSSPNYLPHAKKILAAAGSSRTSGSSTTARSATTSPSSRRCRRPRTCPSRSRSCTTWSCAASWPCSSRPPSSRSPRASPRAGHHFKTEGKVLVNPGWLVIYGREAQGKDDKDANLVPVQKDEKVKTDKVEPSA
jgi:DNA topoisomerase-3